ncbi:hypothetical protein AVEN_239207-1 [Araneus ventricosus]|uniref:Uncharacterized protein n=1 Tax=Araneus ventricosus TaxID=182803 RepID=A0A4Y2G9Y3_ARAVE|nr:hypothetical protein AVEN_239207-1 [Araneus ventricosus]
MAELVSIQNNDFPPQVGKPPQCAYRVLVLPSEKGNEGAVWSANGGFDSRRTSKGSSFHSRRPPVSLQWHNITLTSSIGTIFLVYSEAPTS